jgi:hypothetical protein
VLPDARLERYDYTELLGRVCVSDDLIALINILIIMYTRLWVKTVCTSSYEIPFKIQHVLEVDSRKIQQKLIRDKKVQSGEENDS